MNDIKRPDRKASRWMSVWPALLLALTLSCVDVACLFAQEPFKGQRPPGPAQPAPAQPPAAQPPAQAPPQRPAPGGAPPGTPGPAAVLQAEQLSPAQLDRLPDSQVIDVKGTRMTAGEIRARMQQARAQADARANEGAQKAQAAFQAYRNKFLQEQKAALDASNARVEAEFTKLRQQQPKPAVPPDDPRLTPIRDEARQLLERSKTASPAERAQIEQRAAQLLRQLEQMGVRPAVPSSPPAGRPAPR